MTRTASPARGAAGRVPSMGAATLFAVLFTILAWASAFVGIRDVVHELSPGALALGRLLVAAIALGLLMVGRSWVRPGRRDWAMLVACGVIWYAGYNLALNAAVHHLDAGTSSMIVNTAPILIAVLAGVTLGEGFPRWLVVGMVVAFFGVVLIGLATRGAEADLVGVLLCLVAAFGYAAGVVIQKVVLRRVPPLQATFIGCTFGAICCLPWSGALAAEMERASFTSLAWMVYLGVVPTALAFSTWAYALRRVDAGRLGVTTYLVPPIVILLGWLLLDEIPPMLAVVGGSVCLAGVALSGRRGRVRHPAPMAGEGSPTV